MKTGTIAFVLLLLLSFPGLAAAETSMGTLGSNGEVYLAKVGRYSEIFSGSSDSDPQVLALEILRPGQEPQRELVPESDGVNPEASHFVLFEDASQTVFVVWEGRVGIHPVIQLASYKDGTWSEVIPVSENIWSQKGFPRMAITRDAFELTDDQGVTSKIERTLLHVVWWEEIAAGDRTLYRPLLLQDGRLQALGPLYVLNELASEEVALGAESPSYELVRHPSLQVGRDGQSITVAFADERTRKLLVLDIGLLPMGLGLVSEDLFDFVQGFREAPEASESSEIQSLADAVRARIVIVGSRYLLNPRVLKLLADEVSTELLELPDPVADGPDGLSSLAGLIRARIVIVGARLSRETLDRVHAAEAPQVLPVSPRISDDPADRAATAIPHFVRLTLSSQLPVPAFEGSNVQIFSSPDARRIVVAWEHDAALQYCESVDGTWGEVHRLEVSDSLTRVEALALVGRRVNPGL